MKKISENMIEKAQNLDNKFYMVVGETNISFHDTIDYIRACFEDKKVAEEFIKNQKDKTLHIVEDNGYLKNHQEELSF